MAKDNWQDRNPAATAALVKKLRDQGRLGAVTAVAPPRLRKAIHEADKSGKR
jgi:hypothetical protein